MRKRASLEARPTDTFRAYRPGIYTPFGGWCHGTKFALEALSDCLRLETKPFGIDVVVIEPGGIATEWSGIAANHLEETSGHGPYAPQAAAVA